MSATTALRARNVANASHSTGPRTDAGKTRSSRNAITHGLFSKELLLPGEDPVALKQLRNDALRRFVPRDAMELQLVEQIVADQWRIHRIRGAERDAFTNLMSKKQRAQDKRLLEKYPDLDELLKWSTEAVRRAADPECKTAQSFPRARQKYLELAEKACENAQQRQAECLQISPSSQLLLEMYEEDDPKVQRLSKYEQRLTNSMLRCINQLRKLRQEQTEPLNEFTQALLEQEDAADEDNVQNEARIANDECEMMNDELKNDPNHHSSLIIHHSQNDATIPPDTEIRKTNPDLDGEIDEGTQ